MSTHPNPLVKPVARNIMPMRELPPHASVCTRRLCIPELVSAAAQANPDALALVFGGNSMTYQELDARSEKLAAHLQSLGVGPEVPVALSLERSFDYVVSALAVWKAGGAYLPLDASWPMERRARIIEDSGAPVLVTRSLFPSAAKFIVDLERDSSRLASSTEVLIPSPTSREQLAYVSYTSGTTGTPKGVEITHGNLLNLVFWHRRAFGITAADRASHLAGLAFDAAVWEVWPHLSAGATSVLLADDTVRMSPEHLRDWLVRERISVAFVPTTLAEPLLACSWSKETKLRYLLTGSDTLHRYPRAGLPFRLVNNYGPTECAVVVTSGVVDPAERLSDRPNIGAPITNTQIHILDQHLQPVVAGEMGEIYIGGSNVGRGYRNQPVLTAERFLLNPFRAAADARMYRSGDLGRMLPSGQIEFHGRVDHQEKIRGHRVEPDEVASLLAHHPEISSCAVVGYGDVSDRKLAAYLVPKNGTRPEPSELREFLGRQLPEYMIPTSFQRLEALPLNSSGKLDRFALPAPSQDQIRDEFAYRAPEAPIEKLVAGIVSELLEVSNVGLDDNFFLLGGHSLLGTQVVLRAREQFGVELTLRSLFAAPTVATLAAEIERLLVIKLEKMSEEEAGSLLAQLEQ